MVSVIVGIAIGVVGAVGADAKEIPGLVYRLGATSEDQGPVVAETVSVRDLRRYEAARASFDRVIISATGESNSGFTGEDIVWVLALVVVLGIVITAVLVARDRPAQPVRKHPDPYRVRGRQGHANILALRWIGSQSRGREDEADPMRMRVRGPRR